MIAYPPPIFNVAEMDDVAPVLTDGGYLQWDAFSGQFRTVAVDLSGYAPLDSPEFTGQISISGSSGDQSSGPGLLTLTLTNDIGYVWGSTILAPNLSPGHILLTTLTGRAKSDNDSGYMGFKFAGSGSLDNSLTWGFYANDQLMVLNGHGNVGIGTTTPGAKLEVNGGIMAIGGRFSVSSLFGTAKVVADSFIDYDSTIQLNSSEVKMGPSVKLGWCGGNVTTDAYDTYFIRHAENVLGTPGDLRFSDASRGTIYQDRDTGNFFRVFVASGVLGIELAS